jgi:hypothetical protein
MTVMLRFVMPRTRRRFAWPTVAASSPLAIPDTTDDRESRARALSASFRAAGISLGVICVTTGTVWNG